MPKISPLLAVIDGSTPDSGTPSSPLAALKSSPTPPSFMPVSYSSLPTTMKTPSMPLTMSSTDKAEKPGRLPAEVGRTTSTLPLRYTALQLLHRPEVATVAMKVNALRRSLIRPWLIYNF
uniref:Uncharacterized protein n=1 Tax=Leersia perrieri TaxID=77586 RepID=A0A0D9XHJ3_9ORYZ